MQYKEEHFEEVLTAVRAIEKEYNYLNENLVDDDKKIQMSKNEKEDGERKVEERMKIMIDEKDERNNLKSLHLIFQIQPQPVRRKTLK